MMFGRRQRAFIAQVVRYLSSGHYFYVRCMMKERTDGRSQKAAEEVDGKMLALYDIARPRWRRERRNLKGSAGIHYLRYQKLYAFFLTHGRHDRFYADHGSSIRDIRRQALSVFGYSIRYTFSKTEKRAKVFIRLDRERYRSVRAHMLTICSWSSYREVERMEGEFLRLPFLMYGPVYWQMLLIARAVNAKRRRAGFLPIDYECIPKKLRVTKVYVDEAA